MSSLLASGDLPKGSGTWASPGMGPFRLFECKWKATGQFWEAGEVSAWRRATQMNPDVGIRLQVTIKASFFTNMSKGEKEGSLVSELFINKYMSAEDTTAPKAGWSGENVSLVFRREREWEKEGIG